MRTIGDDLILAGGHPRGTLYAVYTFLEDEVGCRWWTASASTIPRNPTLEIADLEVQHVPAIKYRDTDNPDVSDPDFSVRNKYNGHHAHLFIDNSFSNIQDDNLRGGASSPSFAATSGAVMDSGRSSKRRSTLRIIRSGTR
jgi:hypothetical protein